MEGDVKIQFPTRFMNPYEHHNVETKNAISVDAGEAIVIYKSSVNASSSVGDETTDFDKCVRKVIR